MNSSQVPLLLEIRKNDPLFDVKCTFYRRDLSVPQRRVRVCVSDNENTKLLLALLRVIEADRYFTTKYALLMLCSGLCNDNIAVLPLHVYRDDFDLLVTGAGNSLHRSLREAQLPISVHNELRAMQSLVHLIAHYLAQYPTSYEQDVARLANNDLAPFSNERHAVIQIKGEKEVLLFFRDFAQTAISLLQCTDIIQFDELLEQIRDTKHPVIYYHSKGPLLRLHQEELRRTEMRRRKVDLSRPTVV